MACSLKLFSFVELKKARPKGIKGRKRRRREEKTPPALPSKIGDDRCHHISGKHSQCIGREGKQKRQLKNNKKRRKQLKNKQVSFVSFFFSCLKLLTLENRVSGKS